MKIDILVSDPSHPILSYLENWKTTHDSDHRIRVVHRVDECDHGDILFLVSCSEIVLETTRGNYIKTLVIHASDLPEGRGWSPVVWQVLEGRKCFTVALLEAADRVDSGPVWKKMRFELKGHELIDEINDKLFKTELSLMDFAVANFNNIVPESQDEQVATYYSKRSPQDSRLDPNKSISEQFNLLRVCDPERYPAFFELNGFRYNITISKIPMRNVF